MKSSAIDEVGLHVPIADVGANAVRLIADRTERAAAILTKNYRFRMDPVHPNRSVV